MVEYIITEQAQCNILEETKDSVLMPENTWKKNDKNLAPSWFF